MKDADKPKEQLIQELQKLRSEYAQQVSVGDREIAHINSVLQAVNSTLDLDEVMARVMDALGDVFDFNQISIFLFNAETNHLEVTHWYGEQATDARLQNFRENPLPIDDDDIYFVKCFLDSEPKIVTSITPEVLEHYSDHDRLMHSWNPHRAIGIFPLEVQDKVIGIINFVHTDQPFDVHRTDVHSIQRYVASIATTINNAYLVRKTRFALEKSQQREREISHLNQMIQATNATLDFDEIFQAISSGLNDIFRFEAVGIQLLEPSEGLLNIYKVYGDVVTDERLELWRSITISTNPEDSISSQVYQSGEPFYFPLLKPDDLTTDIDRRLYDVLPFSGYLAFPLMVNGETIGVISFFRQHDGFELSEADLERVQRYVTGISSAIRNARMYQELQGLRH